MQIDDECVADVSEPVQQEPVSRFKYGGGQFEVSSKGVFFFGTDKDGNEQKPRWICAPLYVIAKTRDERSSEWGRLLEWKDDDDQLHQWAMPLDHLEGDGAEVRRELANRGLHISPNQTERALLSAYIKVANVKTRALCVQRLGWHGNVFITPAGAIGKSDEIMVFQNAQSVEPAFSTSGSIADWRNSVAASAQGNSRLMFAISTAFAGALAEIANEDSGGFHLRGMSSSGKSTALTMAASVWGKPVKYICLWRSTLNGMEGLAALHNDGLLILDEIGQVDPTVAGDTAYLLANGQGKTRASRNGVAKPAQKWRVIFLSSGEEPLSAIMARAGKKSTAGQEIRLADIEADAGREMGIFETLHGRSSPAEFAKEIKDRTSQYFGVAGQAWLEQLTANREQLHRDVNDQINLFIRQVVPNGSAGQVVRVARRFALVAVAGELATEYGLTGWNTGDATAAAKTCFTSWLENFGGNGNREERAILAQVRSFFETHGASRFEDIRTTDEQRVPHRAGFFRTTSENIREFIVLPEVFRNEICQDKDEKLVKKVLIKAGILSPAENGQPSQNIRLPTFGSVKAYVLKYQSE